MNKYKPTKGASFGLKQAQALGETLEKIGHSAKPEQLVDAARPKSSPIHSLFEWDDTAAAERYRLWQARNHINHLEVIVITNEGDRSTKAFHSVVVQSGDTRERSYYSVEAVVEDEELNAQVIRKALAELNYWRSKYAEFKAYPELRIVFSAIAKATKRKVAKRRKAKAVA